MKNRLLKVICILLCVLLLLTACGEQTDPGGMDTKVSELSARESSEADAAFVPQADMDWTETNIPVADAIKDAPLYVVDNKSIDYREPAGTTAHTYQQLVYGNTFYMLDTCYLKESTSFYFQQIDGESGTGERISLSPDAWDRENGFIEEMGVIDASRCVFWVSARSTGDWRYYMVYVDNQGQMLQRVELTDTLKENGIWEELENPEVPLGFDGRGNAYIDDVDRHTVYLLDSGGGLAGSHTYRSEDGTGSQGGFCTSGGECVIACGTPGEWEWIKMDAETGDIDRLPLKGINNVLKWYFMAGNICLAWRARRCCPMQSASGWIYQK